MSRWKVTVHNAETARGKLGHWWSDTALFTECGIACAYNDGPQVKLATGWISAPSFAIDCPDCNMPSGRLAGEQF